MLKYGSQEKVPSWCRCSIFLSLFLRLKNTIVAKNVNILINLGRHGILIFSCLLLVLFEKICSIKTWWFCLIPMIVLHYGCFGDFFSKNHLYLTSSRNGLFYYQKKVSHLKFTFMKSVFRMLLVLQNSKF